MFDAHCDTLLKIMNKGDLLENSFDVSFKKLLSYDKPCQIFAVFNNGNFFVKDILKLINTLKEETQNSGVAKFCVKYEDIKNNPKKISALASIEGVGNTPDLETDDLKKFYDAGVRILSITWNNDNFLCGGIQNNNRGITLNGIKFLEEMQKLNMVLDLSHISDTGFYQCVEYKNLNICATHSNSRKICDDKRNLTDEQFKIIVKRGGVAGLNTYPPFVTGEKSANVHKLISHIEHFFSLGGEKNVCLGADFDGISFYMSDIDSCDKMYILADELAKINYTDLQIRGVLCENLMNFYEKMNF